MSNGVDSEPRPRLCHILKWPDFQGYGFNLHAEKGKAGQFIGKVDEDSPASSAGLKSGDRIVEVNGVNIGNENHQQVVKRVKNGGDQTKLLVVDEETDQHFKDQKKVVRGDLPEVLHLRTELRTGQEEPPPMPVQEPESITEEPQETTVIEPVNNNNEDDEHQPRLCHIRKWHDFQGYGFNLHAEKNKPGQYIGKVDKDSPAETAGLKENDRIIEVNGDNVEQEQHQIVIGKIKTGGEDTKLLVVDPKTDAYYKEKGISVTGTMPQVLYQATPHRALPDTTEVDTYSYPSENGETEPEVIPTTSDVIEADNEPEYEPSSHTMEDVSSETLPEPEPTPEPTHHVETSETFESTVVTNDEPDYSNIEPVVSNGNHEEHDYENVTDITNHTVVTESVTSETVHSTETVSQVENGHPAPEEKSPEPESPPPAYNSYTSEPAPTPLSSETDGRPAGMSAKEYLDSLKRKKRADPRNQKMDFKQKYDLFQKM